MSSPYVGEIRMFAGNFAPAGWAFCNGALIPITENETLFALIGTTYGGDGEETFALPDLQGRLPMHQGNGYVIGQTLGVEQVTLSVNQIPVHTHVFRTYDAVANTPNAANNLLGLSSQVQMYFGDPPLVNMNTAMISSTGGSQPHDNMMPYTCINFIISLYGIFPTQN